MKVIGWAGNVNQRIIDQTTFTIGEGGIIEDSNANGFTDTRATALTVPDSYQVIMDFDWGNTPADFQYPVDSDGNSEYDRFIRWYKFKHKKGTNPFWFPAITKQNINNLRSDDNAGMCLYKITSSLSPQKSGNSMRVSMTWKEVYSGMIEMPEIEAEPDSITALNGAVTIKYKEIPDETPLIDDYTFQYSYNEGDFEDLTISKYLQKGINTVFYFEKFSAAGLYEIKVTHGEQSFSYKFYVR